MSARKEAYEDILFFLQDHKEFFNAPYGILESSIPGKYAGSVVAYVITCGQARTMDATIKVFSDTKIEFDSRGYFTLMNGTYESADELIAKFLEYIYP